MNWKRKLEKSWGRLGMKYKRYALSELAIIKYGKNQKKVLSEDGNIPIYGTGGLIGYGTTVLYDKPSVLIGRKGTIGKVKYVEHPFWTIDTLFYTIINTDIVTPKYLYYVMSLIDLNNYNEGTTIPSLRTETLNRLEFNIPSIEEQEIVLSCLNPIDEKIELNNAINNNLEEQAMTLFKSWFIDYEPFDKQVLTTWKYGVLGNFVEIKRGGSPRPIQNFLSNRGLHWLKISDATCISSPFVNEIKEYIIEEGLKKTVFLKAGSLVLSNSATPGLPKILDIDTCIHDGWLYFPSSKFSNEYLYLYFKYIRNNLVALGNGSVFTNLITYILKNYPTNLPTDDVLNKFDKIVKPIFSMILSKTRESKRLIEIRDTLLPKLMSGELDVSNIDF